MSDQTFTREELDDFRSLLTTIKGVNERIEAIEKRGDGIALEKEQKEAIVADILKTVAPEDGKAKQDALEKRLAEVETAMNRPGQTDGKGGTPDERKDAIHTYIRSLGEIKPETKASLSVDSDTAAGYLVHDQLMTKILESEREFDAMRKVATIVQVDGKSITWPKKTAHAAASYLNQESGTATADTALAFGQLELHAHEAMVYRDLNKKLLRASFVDLDALLGDEYGQAFAYLFGESYINGTGSGEAFGMMTDSDVQANNVSCSINASAEIDEQDALIKITTELMEGYWKAASWMMNRTTYGQICALTNGTGNTLFGNDLNNAVPLSLRGKPVHLSVSMPDVANGAYPIAYGDFKRGYVIVDDAAMSLQIDPYTQNLAAQIRMVGYAASGGGVQDHDAIYVIKTEA